MLTRTAIAALTFAMLATGVEANDPFYKGKRLNLLINFAAGGPADIEGRTVRAPFCASTSTARPTSSSRNRDGAGGLVGTNYLGEVAPRDGTMAGYLTAAAWNYVDRSRRLPHRLRHVRVRRLPARQHRLLRAHRHAARREGRRRASCRRPAWSPADLPPTPQGPQDPALARHARRAVQIRHRLPQRRAGAARAAARRDQFLLGILAELFRLQSSRRW